MAIATNPSPGSVASTATGEKPSLILFGGLAVIALFKDLLDLVGLGSLPLIGTVVTLCFSSLIFMLLFLFDRSGGRGNKKLAQGMVMIFGTLIEGLGFVLNFLPLETLTVIFLYIISYRAWKKAEKAGAASQQGQSRKMRLQQVQMARAVAKQEQAAAEAQVAQDSAPLAANQEAIQVMDQERAAAQAMSLAPLVIPSRTPLARPVTATRQPTNERSNPARLGIYGAGRIAANDASFVSGREAANDATYRIRAAGSRMSQAVPATSPSYQKTPRFRPSKA
ncbi:MAG: hypothetical protein WBO92_00180 [Candidatus Moraniibacteriota bacterium]